MTRITAATRRLGHGWEQASRWGCNRISNGVVRVLPVLVRFVMCVAVQNRHTRNGHACDERNQNTYETPNGRAGHLPNVTEVSQDFGIR